jgi:LytS/YehU family sensor histidine kinase
MVPKHILYTHVENAIKHGLYGLNRKGRLHIAVVAEGEEMLMQVEDNGHGAKKSFAEPRPSTGNGLKIMEQMIELYQRRYGRTIEFSVEGAGPESGTRVRIWIRK